MFEKGRTELCSHECDRGYSRVSDDLYRASIAGAPGTPGGFQRGIPNAPGVPGAPAILARYKSSETRE